MDVGSEILTAAPTDRCRGPVGRPIQWVYVGPTMLRVSAVISGSHGGPHACQKIRTANTTPVRPNTAMTALSARLRAWAPVMSPTPVLGRLDPPGGRIGGD